jgi:hypothetical protein
MLTADPLRSQYGLLTFRRVSVWMAGLLVATVGAGALIGFLATSPREAFAWETAAVAGTALATAALAGFTGALAYTTSGDVRATWELAQQGREEQERRDRPTVLVMAGGTRSSESVVVREVRLVNAGVGPALRIQVTATWVSEANQEIVSGAGWLPYLAPGNETAVDVSVPHPDPDTRRLVDQVTPRLGGTCVDRVGRTHEVIDNHPD